MGKLYGMGETLDISHSGVQLSVSLFVFLSLFFDFFLNDKTVRRVQALEAMKPSIS